MLSNEVGMAGALPPVPMPLGSLLQLVKSSPMARPIKMVVFFELTVLASCASTVAIQTGQFLFEFPAINSLV